MIRKKIHLIVSEQDAQIHTNVTNKVWDAADRLLTRCRKSTISMILVTDREFSMKLDAPIFGLVF